MAYRIDSIFNTPAPDVVKANGKGGQHNYNNKQTNGMREDDLSIGHTVSNHTQQPIPEPAVPAEIKNKW